MNSIIHRAYHSVIEFTSPSTTSVDMLPFFLLLRYSAPYAELPWHFEAQHAKFHAWESQQMG